MYVRVSPEGPGRLVRVRLDEIPRQTRLNAARRLREQRWHDDLRPGDGYLPTRRTRYDALLEAVEVTRAAVSPSGRTYRVVEERRA